MNTRWIYRLVDYELDLGQDFIYYLALKCPICDTGTMTMLWVSVSTSILCPIDLKIFGHSPFPSVQLPGLMARDPFGGGLEDRYHVHFPRHCYLCA